MAVKSSSVLGAGADAFAISGAAAALVALIRQQIEARRQAEAKKKRDKPDIDPDTVILRVKKPVEEKLAGAPAPTVRPGVETKEIRPTVGKQPRDLVGRFSTTDDLVSDVSQKEAAAGPTLLGGTGEILATLGGGVLGFYVISKLAERAEQNRLKKQIAAAQTEYLDLLDRRNVKNAEAFSSIFAFDAGFSKEAGIPTDIANVFGEFPKRLRQGGSAMLAAYILAAGGTAYVVKKYLEDRFGKRDEQEKPETPTKILLKASEAEAPFEITPEQMLATVAVLRDCISDSVPPGYKEAASEYDYSFLDDISKMKGGDQWILDSYAKQQGLSRDGVGDFKIPTSTMIKYHHTLSDVMKNPEKHRAALQGHIMGMMQKNPKRWFDLLGQGRNGDLVQLKADEQIANLANSGGFLGFLAKIPLLGGLLKNFMSWFSKNHSWGRKITARKTLEGMGIPTDKANEILKGYDFSRPGQWAPKTPVKQASDVGDWAAFLSRRKTLTDASNHDVIKAIEELKASRKRKSKGQKAPKVEIEFDDELNRLLSEEDKRRIIEGLSR